MCIFLGAQWLETLSGGRFLFGGPRIVLNGPL